VVEAADVVVDCVGPAVGIVVVASGDDEVGVAPVDERRHLGRAGGPVAEIADHGELDEGGELETRLE
jgi:hypothetical protein